MATHNRILIVDDDKATLYVYEHLLSPKYNVTAVLDWLSAIDLLAVNTYDLLILDLKMPVFDPGEFIKRTRSGTSNLPILVTSAYPDLIERVKGLGVSAALIKPVESSQMLQVVSELVA